MDTHPNSLPAVIVSPSDSDPSDPTLWLLTISGTSEQVEHMVETMQTTGGSRWESSGDGFAYCLASDHGRGFYAITNEIHHDGFRWKEGC